MTRISVFSRKINKTVGLELLNTYIEYAIERNLAFGDYRFEDVTLQELEEGVGQVGQPCIKSCKNNNLLIYNTLDNSEEKTHGCPSCPTCPTCPTFDTFSDQIDDNDWCDYLQPIIAKMKDAESRDKIKTETKTKTKTKALEVIIWNKAFSDIVSVLTISYNHS